MPFASISNVFASAELASPERFSAMRKAWRVTVENGAQESLLAFVARESGLTEEILLQRLSAILGWPFIDLPRLNIPAEARQRISTKVAFQHLALPTAVNEKLLQVTVSNPFDTAMLNAVQFDARGPVEFGLAPRVEIEKALKKYYGVGAATLDE
jgi:hypothetical protein